MPRLVAIAFPTREAAMDGRLDLFSRARGHLRDFGDAIVASADEFGTIDIDQVVNLWAITPKSEMLRTVLAGLLFLYPLLAVLPGETPRLIAAALLDFGLGEQALRKMRQMLDPGHAAVFLLVPSAAVVVLQDLDVAVLAVEHVDSLKFDQLKVAFDRGQEAARCQQCTVYSGEYTED